MKKQMRICANVHMQEIELAHIQKLRRQTHGNENKS